MFVAFSKTAFSDVLSFNIRSNQCRENDSENIVGTLFEQTTADIGLHQLISEPTHLVCDSKSCIDLTFIDHPNLTIDFVVNPNKAHS